MNRLNISSWPIRWKLRVLYLLALVLPVAVIASVGPQTISRSLIKNLETSVSEASVRQRQAIEIQFERMASVVNSFLARNNSQQELVDLLEEVDVATTRADVSDETQAEVHRILADVLTQNRAFFDEVWLATLDGRLAIDRAAIGRTTSFSASGDAFVDISDSPAFVTAEILIENVRADVYGALAGERNFELILQEADNQTEMLVVSALQDRTGVVRGVVVFRLNLNAMVLSRMTPIDETFASYSFIVRRGLPAITRTDTQTANLVDLNTMAVQNGLDRIEGIQRYNVGDPPREVLGYSAPILQGFRNDLAFVTEINTSEAGFQFGVPNFLPLILFGVMAIVLSWIGTRLIVPPIQELQRAMNGLARGNFDVPLTMNEREDEIGQTGQVFVAMREQVQRLLRDITFQVEERTRDLEATQEVSRLATQQRDASLLMNEVVSRIIEFFPTIYHAQIFLIEHDQAVLKASTGEPGQQLLARGHQLGVGSLSVIGQVTQRGDVIVARDAGSSDVHQHNEFLPDTRAELALPLKIGNQVIGALDVQSRHADSFDDDLIALLQIMADQVAIAIENARLYEESQKRLRELDRNSRLQTQRAWEDYLNHQRASFLVSEAGKRQAQGFDSLRDEAVQTKHSAIGERTAEGTVPVAIPILLRDEVLGVVEWELPEATYSEDKVLLAEELVNRLAVSLDNARLVQESQRSVENERIVNSIVAKISGQTDIEAILQTAIKEVGQALRAPQVQINLTPREQPNAKNGN